MEFVAVARSNVCIYSFQPEEEEQIELKYKFPAVPTADGCVWSADGALLGLADTETGGVTVYDAASEYAVLCQVAPLIGGPVRNFYFSPLGNLLVTHERYAKDAGDNVGLWDTRSGEMRFSFILKKLTDMTWPPLKWTSLETHCCRMVQDGIVIMAGNGNRDELSKIPAPGIMAFEVAPRGAGTGPPHVAICVAESKGAPARCQTYRLDDPSRPTASKNFFKAQEVSMMWNNTGTALLVRTSVQVDDTGKSYYGGSHLYFMRADGDEVCIIASPDEGAIHDVQWNPTQDEFVLLHGNLPCAMALYDGRKGTKRMDFGSGHRNTIRWNNFGRLLVLGGYGQLLGDTDFWDKPGKKLLGSTRLECCVVCGWAPDGRHFLAATTAPRMRVDNKIQLYDYCGQKLEAIPFEELLLANWRPRPRGAFQDRPPSPGRGGPSTAKAGPAAAAKKQAYRPPNARGGGGLAELLRKELGSTSAETSTTATKVLGQGPAVHSLPPGASPEDIKQAAGGAGAGGAASRNARKKKAKEAAQAAAETPQQETPAAAPAPARDEAPEEEPPAAAAASAAAEGPRPQAAAAAGENPEVEKKVRALRKKLRDIEKLKEKPAGQLDPLQREKIAGEAELVGQLRDLGAEP